MSKQHIQKANGVFIAYFVHTGQLSKEEAQKMSGLDDTHFNEAYHKAGKIAAKVGDDKNVAKLYNHLAEEVEEYMKKISGYGIA
jgi:hypothetical protein